ncbi:DUF294 nucleotidyltransferase-like domain-containing protein [Gracilibacillus alcaliphilus]|uniref:DUF294 nucleotidyltransferase-like domain-containing protein n=1 Tax=Gracilibacillus alcaliphilus TaxID=1401441 RepID=UPI001957C75F|nr:DUF294 nucleotidyltransferase-like domain-containing protein [Gracilibacillus alcaliphilus]MBM7677776.1 CBS domain-containing protein [Gracilibacillus alcaliphilus]
MKQYTEIMEWRNQNLLQAKDYQTLNDIHDEVMLSVVQNAMKIMQEKQGPPPACFAFFVMGSAGRREQMVWSDQDHGIVYDGDSSDQTYFQDLGKEIVEGMVITGYAVCEGKVMASESMWTKSLPAWKRQVQEWLEEENWQSLRHFSTFFDSRILLGEENLLHQIKQVIFRYIETSPRVMLRLIDNVDFIPKGLGVFGQLLVERSGPRTGQMNIKTTTIFPYINALRLLAIWNHCLAVPTIDRMLVLKERYPFIEKYQQALEGVLAFKYQRTMTAKTYDDVHYIHVDSLTKQEKQQWKEYVKQGIALFDEMKKHIENECSL